MARFAAGPALVALVLAAGCGSPASGDASATGTSDLATATPGGEKIEITDMVGRKVSVEAGAAKVFGAGPPATMMLWTFDPSVLVGWNTKPSANQSAFLTDELKALPVLGRAVGSAGGSFNPEVLLQNGVKVIIDAGTLDDSYIKDADELQKKTGIPVVMLSTDPDKLKESYEILGKITGEADRAKELGDYTSRVSHEVSKGAATIPADKKVGIYYAVGEKGLTTAKEGTIHARIIDMIGARNVAGKIESDSGHTDVDAEQVLKWNPDWVVVSPDTPKDAIATNPTSVGVIGSLKAFKNDKYIVTPLQPYSWFDKPPSVNQVLGLVWTAESVYPDAYSFDLVKETRDFYKTFYHHELTDVEAKQMLVDAHTPGF